MNYIEYKQKVVEQNKKNLNNYSLKRESKSFLTIYETYVSVKYRQNKIFFSTDKISNLYVGLFVDGEGIVNGTYIKKIESNHIYLSTFILREGNLKLSFKCELNSKQRWLDWNNEKWKNKIEESSEKINFQEFKRPDNYYLRVKNYYDSRCTRKSYLVYKDPPVIPERLECGDYTNNLDPEDTLYCGQYRNGLIQEGPLYCGFYQNGSILEGPIGCNLYQNYVEVASNLDCAEYQNGEITISQKNCEELGP